MEFLYCIKRNLSGWGYLPNNVQRYFENYENWKSHPLKNIWITEEMIKDKNI